MTTPASEVHVLDHPLVQHKLTLMRQKETQHDAASAGCSTRSASLMAYEVTRDMPMHDDRDRDAARDDDAAG